MTEAGARPGSADIVRFGSRHSKLWPGWYVVLLMLVVTILCNGYPGFVRPTRGHALMEMLRIWLSTFAVLFVISFIVGFVRDRGTAYGIGFGNLVVERFSKTLDIPLSDIRGIELSGPFRGFWRTVTVGTDSASHVLHPRLPEEFAAALSSATGIPTEHRSIWSAAGKPWAIAATVLATALIFVSVAAGEARPILAAIILNTAFLSAIGLWLLGFALLPGRLGPKLRPKALKVGRPISAIVGTAFIALAVFACHAGVREWRHSIVGAVDRASWSAPLTRPASVMIPDALSFYAPRGWRMGQATDRICSSTVLKRDSQQGRIVVIVLAGEHGKWRGNDGQSEASVLVSYVSSLYYLTDSYSTTQSPARKMGNSVWESFTCPSVFNMGRYSIAYWTTTQGKVYTVVVEEGSLDDPALEELFGSFAVGG